MPTTEASFPGKGERTFERERFHDEATCWLPCDRVSDSHRPPSRPEKLPGLPQEPSQADRNGPGALHLVPDDAGLKQQPPVGPAPGSQHRPLGQDETTTSPHSCRPGPRQPGCQYLPLPSTPDGPTLRPSQEASFTGLQPLQDGTRAHQLLLPGAARPTRASRRAGSRPAAIPVWSWPRTEPPAYEGLQARFRLGQAREGRPNMGMSRNHGGVASTFSIRTCTWANSKGPGGCGIHKDNIYSPPERARTASPSR